MECAVLPVDDSSGADSWFTSGWRKDTFSWRIHGTEVCHTWILWNLWWGCVNGVCFIHFVMNNSVSICNSTVNDSMFPFFLSSRSMKSQFEAKCLYDYINILVDPTICINWAKYLNRIDMFQHIMQQKSSFQWRRLFWCLTGCFQK